MDCVNMWLIIYYCIVTLCFQTTIDAKSISIISNNQPTALIRIKRQFGFPSQSISGFQGSPGSPNIDFGNFPGNNGIFFDNNNVFNDFVVPNMRRTDSQNANQIFTTPSQNANQFATTPRPSGTTTVAIPGMGTTRSACEDRCQTTSQFNPVCADNNVTYMNKARFDCAIRCGKRIRIIAYRSCPLFRR